MKPNKVARKLIFDELKDKKAKTMVFVLLGIISGVIEILGVGLVFPFVYLLVSPEAVHHFKVLNRVVQELNINTATSLNIFLFACIASLTCMKMGYSIFYKHFLMKVLIKLKTNLSSRIVRMYLNLDFSYHLENGSEKVWQNVCCVSLIYDQYILSILKIIVALSIVFGFISLLFMVLPLGALFSGVIFVSLVLLLHRVTKNRFADIGVEANQIYAARQKILVTSLGAICETKVFGKEDYFQSQFEKIERSNFTNQQFSSFLSAIPPLIIETGILIGIMCMVTFFLYRSDHAHVLAIFSILVAVMFRLIPQVNHILIGLQLLSSSVVYVNSLADELAAYEEEAKTNREKATTERLAFNHKVSFSSVYYKYANKTNEYALQNINIDLFSGQYIGITGRSAAGKSTFISLLLGLLNPVKGEVLIDGFKLSDPLIRRKWLNNIGYVPQSIFVFEDSIVCNVAYGIEESKVDLNQVKKVMYIAGLEELVEKGSEFLTMPIGENGTKLSGGQKQRLGIARALYHDPSVLILDESTANLDMIVEAEVLGRLKKLTPEKTIILITHRLHALTKCDKVLFFSQGEVLAEGTYDELSNECDEFKKLIKRNQTAVETV